MLDIDRFKIINDDYGHDVGDRVLIEVVRVMESEIREHDLCGRWGGEFLILMPECTAQMAQTVMRRLGASIAALGVRVNEDLLGVTASMGIAELRPRKPIRTPSTVPISPCCGPSAAVAAGASWRTDRFARHLHKNDAFDATFRRKVGQRLGNLSRLPLKGAPDKRYAQSITIHWRRTQRTIRGTLYPSHFRGANQVCYSRKKLSMTANKRSPRAY